MISPKIRLNIFPLSSLMSIGLSGNGGLELAWNGDHSKRMYSPG